MSSILEVAKAGAGVKEFTTLELSRLTKMNHGTVSGGVSILTQGGWFKKEGHKKVKGKDRLQQVYVYTKKPINSEEILVFQRKRYQEYRQPNGGSTRRRTKHGILLTVRAKNWAAAAIAASWVDENGDLEIEGMEEK